MADSTRGKDDDAGWIDITFAIVAAGCFVFLCIKHQFILAGLAGCTSVVYFGQWRQQRWSDWALLALLGCLAVTLIAKLFFREFTWFRIGFAGAMTYSAWHQWRKLRLIRAAEKKDDAPITALVLWQKAPRYLDDKILAQIVGSVWPGDYTGGNENPDCFLVGATPAFMIKSRFGMFLLNNFSRPYFENTEKAASAANELRCRKAVVEHQAWISVDLMGDAFNPASTEEEIYRQIGLLLAELANEETLGMFHPAGNRFYPWSPELAEQLRQGMGLKASAELELVPVIAVAADDSDLRAAVAEARRRWPEFTSAFRSRHPEQMFSVKAALSVAGTTEHIWIEVAQIDHEQVHGRLGNEPVNLGDLKLGDPVSIPIGEIEDWMYLLSDTPVGGFSVRAVSNARKRSAAT